MFNIPEKYYIGKDIALKDFIPQNLKPNDKKKIRDCVNSARLEYQIVGEDIPSVNNEEYHCETIQFYDISVNDIKQSGYIAKTYQSIIKSLCIIRLHDIGKALYSFALKRLSQINEEQIIVTDSMLTDTYPTVLEHERKDELHKLLDYESIKNKTDKINNITNISMLFNGCKNLLSINGNNWYGNKIHDMSYAFNRCEKLASINLGYISTNNVTNMCGLFNGCISLTKIPSVIKNSKIENVEDISIMFQDCTGLESVELSNFNTTKVKDMDGVFSGCSKLKKKVNLKNWSTANVQGMIGLFKNCTALTEVILPGKMNLGKVKNASGMFYGCENLKTINNIDNLKFSNTDVKVENFFDNCKQLDKKDKYLNGLVIKSKNKIK